MTAPATSATFARFRSRYRWNEASGRYITANGRFVPQASVRRALDGALQRAQTRFVGIANDLRESRISLTEWERRMREAVKDVHLYSAAAARGGWAQMSAADFGRVGRIVRDQYTFLNRFAADIASGAPLDGRFLQRVELYAQSGRRTFHLTERFLARARGMTEERSVLHPAEHCAVCVAEAARGWVPIGQLIPIGERTCLSRDQCSLEFR